MVKIIVVNLCKTCKAEIPKTFSPGDYSGAFGYYTSEVYCKEHEPQPAYPDFSYDYD